MMHNAFRFILKSLFVLTILKLLTWLLDHVGKRLENKPKVNLQIYDITTWLTNNYNTHTAQYLKK